MVQNSNESRRKYWATRWSVCSFAHTAHSFACSGLRPPLRKLVRSLAHFAHSLSRGKVNYWCHKMTWFCPIVDWPDFPYPFQLIMTAESRVVQLDFYGSKLLVSTMTKSFLCDTEKQQFWTVGAKPRNGVFGACFFQPESVGYLIVCHWIQLNFSYIVFAVCELCFKPSTVQLGITCPVMGQDQVQCFPDWNCHFRRFHWHYVIELFYDVLLLSFSVPSSGRCLNLLRASWQSFMGGRLKWKHLENASIQRRPFQD